MQTEFVNIGLGLLEGFALIISPCILPILPIILAGSLTGSKRRPLGIIIGFVVTFALFTYFSRKLVQYSGIDLNLIRIMSFGILLLLGLIMLSTYLTDKFSQFTQRLTQVGSRFSTANNPQGGLLSGILFGGLIALVWTPCAGPILAAVIVQTVIQKSNWMSFLVLLAFGLGAAIPMLMIAVFGRKLLGKFNFITLHTALFRKALGIVIILCVGYMIYFSGGVSQVSAPPTNNTASLQLQKALATPYKAPVIEGIDAWVNSAPLQLTALQGKVILIDFWTYSCINCIRTIPYLNNLYRQYHDKGLEIIGVHTPEFDFEKNIDNVKSAVIQREIKYPVALDSHFITWQKFNNHYWPAHYLIDQNGYVVYTHFGEGDYDITENNIRFLLGVNNMLTKKFTPERSIANETPETYLGYSRADHFSSPESVKNNQTAEYSFPHDLNQDDWAVRGQWRIMSDRIIADQKDAAIEIKFHARKVHIVIGNPSKKPITIKLLLNGKELVNEQGKDVVNSTIQVTRDSLYEAIALTQPKTAVLQIISDVPGLELYTFTFG